MYAPAAEHPPAPVATFTDQGAILALYTGPTTPAGNAGDWWLPHYPDTRHPHTHDGTAWELAAPDAPAIVGEVRRRDLIALVFAAITADSDGTGQLGHRPTVAA